MFLRFILSGFNSCKKYNLLRSYTITQWEFYFLPFIFLNW